MRQSQGYDVLVAFGKEAAQGTAPAASVFKNWGIVSGFEPEINKNHEQIRGLGARTVLNNRALEQSVGITYSGYLQNPTILYYTLGKSVASGTTGAYIHSISAVGRCEELPTFTAQSNMCVSGTPFVTNYLGSKIDTLTISATAGEPVEVEADIVSVDFKDNQQPAASYDVSTNEIFTFANGIVEINGVPAANVKEFEIEIANNLEAIYTISKTNGNAPAFINDGVLDVTGSFTFAPTGTTQRTLFRNGTEFNVSLKFEDPIVTTNYIVLNLTGAKYDTDSLGIEADGEVDYEVDVLFKNVSISVGSKDIADLTV